MVFNFNGADIHADMFGGFNMFGEPIQIEKKVWVGEALVEHNNVQIPSIMFQQALSEMVLQIANSPQPMKLEIKYVGEWENPIGIGVQKPDERVFTFTNNKYNS